MYHSFLGTPSSPQLRVHPLPVRFQVVLTAVRQEPRALQHAAPELRTDPTVLAAVGRALNHRDGALAAAWQTLHLALRKGESLPASRASSGRSYRGTPGAPRAATRGAEIEFWSR